MNIDRLVKRTALAVMALVLYGVAHPALAQTQAWDTNVISYTPPTACSTGEPITACPVTGYRLERAASSSGTYTALATLASTATGYTHNSAVAGTNCYRVVALSAQGDSLPSNTACKVNTKPVGPPNPPVLKTIDAVAYNVKPDFQRFAFVRGAKAGQVKLGSSCDESRQTSDGYMVISRLSQVTPRPATGTVLVARCG